MIDSDDGGDIVSFGFDLIPGIGECKGLWEAFTGKDTITGGELNGFDRIMGVVGGIPLVGPKVKCLVKSKKVIKGIDKTIKYSKKADKIYTYHNFAELNRKYKNDD